MSEKKKRCIFHSFYQTLIFVFLKKWGQKYPSAWSGLNWLNWGKWLFHILLWTNRMSSDAHGTSALPVWKTLLPVMLIKGEHFVSRSLHCKVQVSFMDVKCQIASVVQLKVFCHYLCSWNWNCFVNFCLQLCK